MTGWKTAYNDSNYQVLYNDELVSVSIHVVSGVPYTNVEKELGAEILKHGDIDLRPKNILTNIVSPKGIVIMIKDNSYKLWYYSLSSSLTAGAYGHFTYKRK